LSVLVAENIVGGYGASEEILKGASVRVGAGEIVTIIGPNGAGKSTLLKAIAGLLEASEGRILFHDADVTAGGALDRARAGIAFVPQERNVFGTLSVAENLSISAFLAPHEAAARAERIYHRYAMLADMRKAQARTLSIAFFARRDSTVSFDGDLGNLREVKIGIIQGTSYGQRFDAAVTDGALRNFEQANSAESNLKKLAFGRVDLIPSYRYVALDTAKKLDLLSQIKEVSPPLESVPTYLAFTKVRDLSKQSEGFDAALASMKQDGTYDRIIGQYP
jgi:ABC-type Fe3+/spermidine/putrescine transport system ATPase subunit